MSPRLLFLPSDPERKEVFDRAGESGGASETPGSTAATSGVTRHTQSEASEMTTANGYQDEKCYACGKKFRKNSYGRIVFHPEVLTVDGQRQFVGHDCYRRVINAGVDGWQSPRGGPRLFTELHASQEVLLAAGITLVRK